VNSGREREFHFTDGDFQRIRRLIYEHAGISLNPNKSDMVYSRIARRLRATGNMSFNDYLDQLQIGSSEWQQFVNALTTNLTSFFREAHHFPILAEYVTRFYDQGRYPIRLWSAACSTGEEPYSMAMAVIDAFGSFTPPVQILATDLGTHVLDKASQGVYPYDRVEKMPQSDVRRFFLRGKGKREGWVRIRPEVQNLVSFHPLNLLGADWPVKGSFDAIFCRNVLIYFDKSTQYRLLSRFHPLMNPNGLLFIGHSESLSHASDLFRLQGKTVYVPVEQK
jgi:chemotaxis protein methyltransferase CheR